MNLAGGCYRTGTSGHRGRLRQKTGLVVLFGVGRQAYSTYGTRVDGLPIWEMSVKDGVTVPANFGAVPVWEADMLLVVKDEGISRATTPEQALRHISGMRPFIELPDWMPRC